MQQYFVTFRHILPVMMFTPLYLIPPQTMRVEVKENATEYDLLLAVCNQVANLNYNPDHIRIEDIQKDEMQATAAPDKQMTKIKTGFLSAQSKIDQFQNELKELLAKYDAELAIEDFGRDWSSDEKIVVSFSLDKDLANRTNDGIIPDLVIGRWMDSK